MSTRQIRRFKEQMQAAKPEENKEVVSEEAFEPLYVNSHNTSFNVLEPDSSPMSAWVEDDDDDEDASEKLDPAISQKKKKNNRKKKNKKREYQAATSAENPDSDEVDRALAEVNSLLGEPECPAASVSGRQSESSASATLLQVNHKYLSAEDELNRRFGPDDEKRRNQRPNVLRQLKRQIMLPNESYNFSVNGLSLKQIDEINGVKYFKLFHSPKYQMNLRTLLVILKRRLANTGSTEYDVYTTVTIEAILQNVDLYFMLEEASVAINALEGTIHILQSIFCPLFNYTDGKTILEYEYVENRVFHIILLKYLHLVTNKACHRTALEIAKLLLNLDPSDPLAVIFIIDTLALRAREHQWLVDIYQHWSKERDAGRLFHLQYSHALAKYHLYLKSKKQEDLDSADYHLREAMLQYPNVAVMLLEHTQTRCPTVTNHELYTTTTKTTTSEALCNLQKLYVAFAGPKWREGNIMKWFVANAVQLSKNYDNDPQMKVDCHAAATARSLLFKENPIEIDRHLYIIRSMSSLIVDGAVPNMKETYAFNPYPTRGASLDPYAYFSEHGSLAEVPSAWRSFLNSVVPVPPDNDG